MPAKDLREWIDDLEERNDLKRITAEVDWDEEIGAITREISSQFGPALLFENIKGHRQTLCRRLFTNGTGTRERCAGCSEFQRKPLTVSWCPSSKIASQTGAAAHREQGPVKENIVKGDAVDLFQFPVPKWNPHDGGRFIMTSASIVTKDPDTGILNAGTYRGMIGKKNTIGVLLAMTRDGASTSASIKIAARRCPWPWSSVGTRPCS